MSSEPPQPADNFSLWLVVSAGLVGGAALVSASREKPFVLFALVFGLAMGMVSRLAADSLTVRRSHRVALASALLASCGFLLCFVVSYRRAAQEWDRQRLQQPSNPLAIAVLKSLPPEEQAELQTKVPPFTPFKYLERRVPAWPFPWPEVLFGAEWISCGLIAGCCAGFRPFPRRNSVPVKPDHDETITR